jgi:hypothetical protein
MSAFPSGKEQDGPPPCPVLEQRCLAEAKQLAPSPRSAVAEWNSRLEREKIQMRFRDRHTTVRDPEMGLPSRRKTVHGFNLSGEEKQFAELRPSMTRVFPQPVPPFRSRTREMNGTTVKSGERWLSRRAALLKVGTSVCICDERVMAF